VVVHDTVMPANCIIAAIRVAGDAWTACKLVNLHINALLAKSSQRPWTINVFRLARLTAHFSGAVSGFIIHNSASTDK
jgi:hypothetical protein